LLRLIGDIRCLVVGTNEAVEEEHGMPRAIPVFLDLQSTTAPHDEDVVEHVPPRGLVPGSQSDSRAPVGSIILPGGFEGYDFDSKLELTMTVICSWKGLAGPGDYTPVWNDDWTVRGFRCRCGITYQKVGRRFVQLSADGSRKPYLIWSRLKGWIPDREDDI
jgi:hypothetical protein